MVLTVLQAQAGQETQEENIKCILNAKNSWTLLREEQKVAQKLPISK